MKYDFTKVHRVMAERGLTLVEVARKTKGAVDYTTISKALRRGSAHQSTAKAITKALGLSMKDLLRKSA